MHMVRDIAASVTKWLERSPFGTLYESDHLSPVGVGETVFFFKMETSVSCHGF